ncbi:NFU1 [Candida pseudojiufengensis]|uniref:NFU1 n=1 Tax=Candida pseudojiufengensis TaxID=497109 RepID=UPI0022248718|nr:NFU1 [Candida pseudojiufengensis]KAI5964709.1 NFU1 [Candida pseudojiufengensis]
MLSRTLMNRKISQLNIKPLRLLHFKTASTPNENALKFISPECPILPLENTTFEFTSTLQAIHSPLALQIFKIPGVKSIMLGADFLTVNKLDNYDWNQLTSEVMDTMNKFLDKKKDKTPVITQELIDKLEQDKLTEDENDSEIVSMIKELIETRIRPAIQDDGGDIEYKGFDEETGTVFLKLQGACKSCSASEDTLKNGIESMLKHYIEEVKEVEQILDPEEEIAMKEFERLEAQLGKKSGSQAFDDGPPSL